jgi:alcohol dehydrogenase
MRAPGERPMWRYRNPVDIRFGAGSLAELPALVRQRRYAVVTYSEPMFADVVARCAATAGAPALVVDDVAPNPDCALLADQAARFRELSSPPDVIVAVGGGSVIDSAKVFAAAGGDFGRVQRFLETKQGVEQLSATPIIAVPTTAGTGSEVTPWATVWDTQSGQKYSLSRPGLFPEHALIDPLLMVEKPRGLTVSTGLDALSHALESLWNVNSNPVSASHAVAAAREILDALPRLVADLRNVALRTRMAKAALFAGLAFSNTQTAIAHSISYPFTLHYGVPHGIACSFTLPAVMRSVIGCGGLCEASLRSIFGDDLHAGARQLERMIEDLGVATQAGGYGVDPDTWAKMIDDAFGGERGRNFIGSRAQLLAAVRQPSPASAAAAG